MANNFRKTGDYYISKAGHDSNDGLTTDTPKKSLAINAGINVFGTGIYGAVYSTNANATILGDGIVIFDASNGVFAQNPGGAQLLNIDNITFSNTDYRLIANAPRLISTNCIFLNSTITSDMGQTSDSFSSIFTNCIFANTSLLTISTNSPFKLDYCICTDIVSNISKLINSYCSFFSVITINSLFLISDFYNNNIQGTIILEGVSYAIQDQFIGTPQDNGYTAGVEWLTESNLTTNGYTGAVAGWNAAVATCINRDPQFNDSSKLDFTLKATSQHLGRASDGVSNIGGTEYAQAFYAGISNPNILKLEGDADVDSITNVNDWVLEPTSVQGAIRAIVKISDIDEQIGLINYIGNYSFDSDEIGGTSGNFNVPDSKPVTNAYPSYDQTTSDAANTTSVVIVGHSYSAGQWLKVEGQYREIDSVDANTLYFLTAVRAIVLSGTDIQMGSFSLLAALNPNRLNMLMRTSTQNVNSGNWDDNATWDNNSLATAGTYLAQEWNNVPMIDNLNGVGFGDDNYDSAFGNTIQAKYADILIYLRDDYKS